MRSKKVRLPRKQKKMLKKIYQAPDENWYIITSLYCGWLNHFSPGTTAKYKGKIKGWKTLIKSREHFSAFKGLNLDGELNIQIIDGAEYISGVDPYDEVKQLEQV